MKSFFLLLLLVPSFSYAHCPISFEVEGVSYCTDIEWLNGDYKVQGSLVPSSQMSPHLIAAGEVPQKWIYSRARFPLWLEGDRTHAPQMIAGLRVFPYMVMENGHHHSTSHEFEWNDGKQVYELTGVAFQEMPGCWSLRWTVAAAGSHENSHQLISISNFQNSPASPSHTLSQTCEVLELTDLSETHHH